MGHKTKADRQREAQVRMAMSEVPHAIENLKQALQLVRDQGPGNYPLTSVRYAALSLHKKWQTLYGPHSNGMMYAMLNGGDGTGWTSTSMNIHEMLLWYYSKEERKHDKKMERTLKPDARDRWLMGS